LTSSNSRQASSVSGCDRFVVGRVGSRHFEDGGAMVVIMRMVPYVAKAGPWRPCRPRSGIAAAEACPAGGKLKGREKDMAETQTEGGAS